MDKLDPLSTWPCSPWSKSNTFPTGATSLCSVFKLSICWTRKVGPPLRYFHTVYSHVVNFVLLLRYSFKWIKRHVGVSLRTAMTSCSWCSLHSIVSGNLCRQTSNTICYWGPYFPHLTEFLSIFMLGVIITWPYEKLNRAFLLLLHIIKTVSSPHVLSFSHSSSQLSLTRFLPFFFISSAIFLFLHASILSSCSTQPLIRGEWK